MNATNTTSSNSTQSADSAGSAEKKKEKSQGFTFTDPGCRSDIRIGALLVCAAAFLWQFLGPQKAMMPMLVGVPLLLIGVPLQAMQVRKGLRPGYPWKLGVAMTIIGALMFPQQLYQERFDAAVEVVMPWIPGFLFCGIWILAWLPVARPQKDSAPRSVGSAAA